MLQDWLVDHGWQQCKSEPCIYIIKTGTIFAMIALYANDISAKCNDIAWMTAFKVQFRARLKIKDTGELSRLMDMHITRDMTARTISMNQTKSMKDILVTHGMTGCKPSSLPMDPASCPVSPTWIRLFSLDFIAKYVIIGSCATCSVRPFARALLFLKHCASSALLKPTPRKLISKRCRR
jgi:hypothetical protein